MAFTVDPTSQFGYSNQTFGYMAIFERIYIFIHDFQLSVLKQE